MLGALRAVLFAPEDLALVRGPLLVAGVGSGLFIAASADFIVATVESADAGAASGVIGTMQRVGSAIGMPSSAPCCLAPSTFTLSLPARHWRSGTAPPGDSC